VDVERDCTGERDRIVVRCVDDLLGQSLIDLFFRRENSSFVKEFAPGSFTDPIFARLQEALLPMLRQTAWLEQPPWESALVQVARRLAGLEWWVACSAALARRGLPLVPRDLDLVVERAAAGPAAVAFDDVLVEPVVQTEDWFCRWFGRAWLGARVEWVADVTEAADQPDAMDFGLRAASELAHVSWNGLEIRVPPIQLQRAVSARRGLADRVALIDAYMRHKNGPRS
jgi:hypothetical protein